MSNSVFHTIRELKLGYQKDNNAAAHSVDIYVFCAVIHLQCIPSCMMTHRWRGVTTARDKRAHIDLNCV